MTAATSARGTVPPGTPRLSRFPFSRPAANRGVLLAPLRGLPAACRRLANRNAQPARWRPPCGPKPAGNLRPPPCARVPCQNPAVADLDELNIPKAARPVAEEIIGITDEVCAKLLDAEYASLARQVVAKLARKRPSPLHGGRRVTWAAAVVYALGQVNFLFDSSGGLHRTPGELGAAFGVAKTTMGSKAKQVRDMLKMSYFKPEFLRTDVIAENPMVWFIEVEGLPTDARSLPLDLQTVAFRRGYIPYIPALGPEGTAALMQLCTGRSPGPRMTAVPPHSVVERSIRFSISAYNHVFFRSSRLESAQLAGWCWVARGMAPFMLLPAIAP